MIIIIMAGGRGTRISSVNSEIPKPMIPLLGKPVLEYELEAIKAQGYEEVMIVVGHLKQAIMEYFGDGKKWGLNIRYIEEDSPLGTAGALYYLRDRLKEDMLLLNGDTIFDVDIQRMYKWHKLRGGVATILTHPNDHPYDSGIVVTDQEGCVQEWMHKENARRWYRNCVNAGIHVLSPEIFQEKYGLFSELRKLDLDRDVLKPLISRRELYAYSSPEYVKDMGTPDRLKEVEGDIKSGKVCAKNLKRKQKAVFLDRDGTINQYVGFVRDAEELELLPGTAAAIRSINQLGYLAIIVTNQPVIARGEVTVSQLQEIHNKLETLLGQEGAYVDAIYYCPHHPDKGFEGEIEELKINCSCRKPKPGMLYQAAEDFNIELSESWMIGDRIQDISAGRSAGCRTVYLGSPIEEYGQTYTMESLEEFVCKILEVE